MYHVSWRLIEGALIRAGFTLKATPRRRAMPGPPETNKLHKRGTTPLSTSHCASLITRRQREKEEEEEEMRESDIRGLIMGSDNLHQR